MTHVFKKAIHSQMWRYVAASPNAHAAGGSICTDLRNTVVRHPFVFQLVSATVLNRYNIITKGWQLVTSPALTGTFGAGAGCVFAPSLGLVGSIGAGCTTTSIVTTTVMTAVGANMLGNRGGSGDYGFKIRIKGNAAGSSGKIEERWIVGNTLGTTPTITLDSALSFTPANGDTYEILAGKVFMLSAGVLAAGCWKSFEVGANTLSGNLGTTNLPATIGTDSSLVCFDEEYVPYDHEPGEGFVVGASTYNGGALNCLVSTAIGASSITGQAAAGDAEVLANEYRNFQIRIVEDTAAPTAVGQRRIIASHTAGASPVYTLGTAWTVNPSVGAKYVIEYPNLIVVRSSASTSLFTYNYSGATINNGTNSILNDAWSVTYFAAGGTASGAGTTMFPSFGIQPDAAKNSRHSHLFVFRGASASTLDLFDIAGGTTGAWSAAIVYDGAQVLTTGSCGCYAPVAQEGKFGYFTYYVASAINQMFRFDVKNRVMNPYTPTDYLQAGTAGAGTRIACCTAIDGTDKYSVVLLLGNLSAVSQELVIEV